MLAIPAGGTATATVTLNHTLLDAGQHTGRVLATSGDGARLATPVGFTISEQTYPVTVTVRHSDNPLACGNRVGAVVEPVDGRPADSLGPGSPMTKDPDGCSWTGQIRLPAGIYTIHGSLDWMEGITGQRQDSWLIDPEVAVRGDHEVVLDAADAEKVRR